MELCGTVRLRNDLRIGYAVTGKVNDCAAPETFNSNRVRGASRILAK